MIQETPQAERFKQQLRNSLRKETQDSRAIKIAKHNHVYTCVSLWQRGEGLVKFFSLLTALPNKYRKATSEGWPRTPAALLPVMDHYRCSLCEQSPCRTSAVQ
jgi:hypothetical protein